MSYHPLAEDVKNSSVLESFLALANSGLIVVHVLTVSHVLFGAIALLASTVAVFSKLFAVGHRVHVVSGLAFVMAMIGIAVTAIPLSIIHPNLFLRLIAIFSLYLALSGWRFAKNRQCTPHLIDHALVWAMTITGLAMTGYSGMLWATGSSNAVVLTVFGVIGLVLSQSHRRSLLPGQAHRRIILHLTLMLGGTIAAWTALTVTQITSDPPWVAWLAPTALFLPLIVSLRGRERRQYA